MNEMQTSVMNGAQLVHWRENNGDRSAAWRSAHGLPPPKRIICADDRLTADQAWHLACEGTALLWRGDFHNARQLLDAMARRIDRKPRKPAASITDAFHRHRLTQAQRAHLLNMLLLPFEDDYRIGLRRAPDVREACEAACGPAAGPFIAPLRELQGLIGAHEWRKKGVWVPELDARIHPHYAVFSPVRGEYVRLVAEAPLPGATRAFDIGTGTGVLAAVLAKRGVREIIGTDQAPQALACATDNIDRLGLSGQVRVVQADLFPEGRAPLVVCNPPWLPGRPAASIEQAIFDPDSRMLRGFLNGLADHLSPGGEGWLILSDFAEHLELRTRDELLAMIDAGGLKVVGSLDARPRHPKAADPTDPLHIARAAETTRLWRLAAR